MSNRVDEALLSVREEPDPIRWTFTRKTHTCKYTYNVYTHLQITEGGTDTYTVVTHVSHTERRVDVENHAWRVFSRPPVCASLPSGSLAMTVLLRSTPPFLSSVQHTHIHITYTDMRQSVSYLISFHIFSFFFLIACTYCHTLARLSVLISTLGT